MIIIEKPRAPERRRSGTQRCNPLFLKTMSIETAPERKPTGKKFNIQSLGKSLLKEPHKWEVNRYASIREGVSNTRVDCSQQHQEILE